MSRPLTKGLFTRRVTLASGLTLAGRLKIARVYKQNFTGRVTLQLKGSGNKSKVNSALPRVFTKKKPRPSIRVKVLGTRLGNPLAKLILSLCKQALRLPSSPYESNGAMTRKK